MFCKKIALSEQAGEKKGSGSGSISSRSKLRLRIRMKKCRIRNIVPWDIGIWYHITWLSKSHFFPKSKIAGGLSWPPPPPVYVDYERRVHMYNMYVKVHIILFILCKNLTNLRTIYVRYGDWKKSLCRGNASNCRRRYMLPVILVASFWNTMHFLDF